MIPSDGKLTPESTEQRLARIEAVARIAWIDEHLREDFMWTIAELRAALARESSLAEALRDTRYHACASTARTFTGKVPEIKS